MRSPFPALVELAVVAGLAATPAAASAATDAAPPPAKAAAQAARHATAPPETIVVTASRTEQTLARAPAAVSIVDDAAIGIAPADDFGDLLRNVPGLNVAQTSVRDINMTARGATSTVASSQLVLLDGRSIYLDFFGIVMWDFLPVQATEIDRIEVVRGPGSAVWGANAMTGVVNVISKRPREIAGTSVVLGTRAASVVHARAAGTFSYKLTAGALEQPAYERPRGVVPGSSPPQTYPDFRNRGTEQRRINAKLEWDYGAGYFALGVGSAATGGILHSGIGPFAIEPGALFSYVDADWHGDAARLRLAATRLDGDARNLLTLAADGSPLGFAFLTDSHELDYAGTRVLANRHTLSYGGTARASAFALEIAPAAADRNELGLYVQDEIPLTDRLRWVVGARYDDIEPLTRAVVTPRTSFLLEARPDTVLRLSYNEAFRTPSAINNFLDVAILQQAGPLRVPAAALGNARLGEERLTAYELGMSTRIGNGVQLSIDAYRNKIANAIDFYVVHTFGPDRLPPSSPSLPEAAVGCFAFAPGTGPAECPFGGLAGLIASDYSYRNVGRTVNRGVEVALAQPRGDFRWFANVSWQDEPDVEGVSLDEVNRPPAWRVNAGIDRDRGARFYGVNLNYQSAAHWSDVLFARAATGAFAQLNASLGFRFRGERLTLKLIGQNLFDERVQQHVFGDILARRITAQLAYEL